MPFEMMDKRGVSSPSHLFEELSFRPERQIGFWKLKTTHDQQVETDGISATLGGEVVSSSPLEKLLPIGVRPVVATDLKEKHVGGEGTPNFSSTSWKIMDDLPKSWSNLSMQPTSYSMDGKMININGTQYESSLFSSSLSEIFSSKLRLPGKDVLFHQPSNAVASHYEEEPFESLEEIEAQTIGNLLPDGDDLFSGLMDELGHYVNANTGDDIDDFDLFSSGGGMELEGSDHLRLGQRKSDFIGVSNGPAVSNIYTIHEHPNGELPSRSLLVRNIDFNVEDSELKGLFELYGDIRSIYTSWKRHDFVIISYYDLRAARNAMKELQRNQFRGRKLDILYCIPKVNPLEKDVNQGTLVVLNLDSSVSNDNLRQIFGIYGEIKEIRETPQKSNHKVIEFYDVRAAEAALRALNKSEIAGKQVKLELSLQGAARRCLMTQSERGQDEPSIFRSACDNYSMSGRLDMIQPKKFTHGVVASRCMDSAAQSPVSAFIENTFPHPSSSTSPARVASVGNQFGLRELNHSMGEVKFGHQGIPSFHPHSLPEYHDSLANGIPRNSSINIADMANNGSPRMAEGIDKRHIQGVSINGHSLEFNGGVFGSSGNGSSPLHRHIWSNSNSYQHGPPNPMIWPNSPSFANGVHAHRIQQVPGFPGVPPHMMTSVSPVHHHVGSAPAVNPSIWDRRYAYSGESPEASSFQLGSVGSVGFPTGSPLPPMEISSHSVFSPVGGNCMDMTSNAGFRSPQMCHIFPGRNPMISLPASFDSPNDRVRNLSHRRNEANSNTVDKKQYELDIDRILRGEDTRTTLMLKNIPNKYTSKMLLAAIDEHCRGTYDFIYLPIDFKNKCNVGYAFINMIDPLKILPFHQAFSGKKWEKFNSEKVAYLAYARIQGKTALVAHFQNSSLMNEDKRCRPILFHTDGPNAGDQEPFPMGSNIRSRPGKSRSSGNEENHNQGGSPIFVNGEESSNGRDSSPGSSKDSD